MSHTVALSGSIDVGDR